MSCSVSSCILTNFVCLYFNWIALSKGLSWKTCSCITHLQTGCFSLFHLLSLSLPWEDDTKLPQPFLAPVCEHDQPGTDQRLSGCLPETINKSKPVDSNYTVYWTPKHNSNDQSSLSQGNTCTSMCVYIYIERERAWTWTQTQCELSVIFTCLFNSWFSCISTSISFC